MDGKLLQKLQETISPKWMESISDSLSIHQLNPAFEHFESAAQEIAKTVSPLKSQEVQKMFEALDGLKATNDIFTNSSIAKMEKLAKQVASSTTLSHLEQWKSLESFKALSRLEDFPISNTEYYSKQKPLDSKANAAVKELDAKISENIKSVSSFDQLNDEDKEAYLTLHANYYLPVIIHYLTLIVFYKIFLDERMNFSNVTFTRVNKYKFRLDKSRFSAYTFMGNYLLSDAITKFIENIFIR